jgi:hypothetical protein
MLLPYILVDKGRAAPFCKRSDILIRSVEKSEVLIYHLFSQSIAAVVLIRKTKAIILAIVIRNPVCSGTKNAVENIH